VVLASLVVLLSVAPVPLDAEAVSHQVEALWRRRDDPAAMSQAKVLLDGALARAPDDYGLLWRATAWHFWSSDDPSLPTATRAQFGKAGWDLAERAVARNPGHVAGHFWAALTMGNYALGLGIMRAIGQGIEGKFRERIGAAERLDPRYANGGIQNAWGGYYLTLPWPKRDLAKAEAYFKKALVINPHNLRTRVYLAELRRRQDRLPEARQLLEEVLRATPDRYDPPEEKRAQKLAAEALRKVVDAMK
jgi:tetratricopeptide (TPR) repeat protein